VSNHPCRCCKGRKHVTVKMRNLSSGSRRGGDDYVYGRTTCPACMGKGYTDATDHARVQSVEMYEQIVG